MELTGLTQMRRRLIGNLSKGYRQRAGMAQALCGSPEVIILDEESSGDLMFRKLGCVGY